MLRSKWGEPQRVISTNPRACAVESSLESRRFQVFLIHCLDAA